MYSVRREKSFSKNYYFFTPQRVKICHHLVIGSCTTISEKKKSSSCRCQKSGLLGQIREKYKCEKNIYSFNVTQIAK